MSYESNSNSIRNSGVSTSVVGAIGRQGGRGIGRGRGGGRGGGCKPGDWDCIECGNVGNYASRMFCYRCNTPKPDGAAAAKVTSVAAGGGAKGRGSCKPGDWDCIECGNVGNYASRMFCYRCNTPKPDGAAAAKVTPVAEEAAGAAAKVTPVAGGAASGATPSNTWAARTSEDLPDDDEMLLRKQIKKRQAQVAWVRSVYGDNTPTDIATVLRLYELLHGSKPVMTGPVKVQYSEWMNGAKKNWNLDVSPTGTFAEGPYTQVPTLEEHKHIGGAAKIFIYHTPEKGDKKEEFIMVFLTKKVNEDTLTPEEEKKAASKERKAVLNGVTNEDIQHRCCTYTVYDRDGNEKHLPQAFADLANKAGFDDPEKVWFTTMVLTPELFEEYIAVVDGNNATRNEQVAIHNKHVELVKARGAAQCPKFPSQVLLRELGPLPNGTVPKNIFDHIAKELPHLPGFRTGYDVVRYEDGRIIVVRLPNLNGSTPSLNQKWSAIVHDWYAENKDSIAQKILTDIRAYNREWREQNKADRMERARYTGDVVSFGAGTGKGSHRKGIKRAKQANGKTGASAQVAPAPTKTTQSSAVSDSDFEKLICLLKRKWSADEKRFSDEEDTWRKQTLRSLTAKQQTDMRNRLR